MRALFYASLAVVPWVAVTLLVRWLISFERLPVGLVGTMSRMVTVPVLGGWVLSRGLGWRRLRPRGKLAWLLLMGAISVVINIAWFAAVRWTTATNMAVLIRFDVLFVVLIGAGLAALIRIESQAALSAVSDTESVRNVAAAPTLCRKDLHA